MWNSEAEPNEDNSKLEQTAKRELDHGGSDDSTSKATEDKAKKQRTEVINNPTDTNDRRYQTNSETLGPVQPIDAAIYLAKLGESVCKMGVILIEQEDESNMNNSLSILVDTLLCILEPLFCLAQQVPELYVHSQDILENLMDDLDKIMQGF
ncbi:Hypothetical protein CINCED_3A005840 [Cinara cedri]|uniref:Uncharacterized protein n=2 Tax=Cinara cedri TaxID=506608 RepID=A0A5E4M7V7_9HEMI|nr:Hypothetical protein CINCED_3A005840 [Cinara cedri]